MPGQRPRITEPQFFQGWAPFFRCVKPLVAGETGLEPATLGFGALMRLKIGAILASRASFRDLLLTSCKNLSDTRSLLRLATMRAPVKEIDDCQGSCR